MKSYAVAALLAVARLTLCEQPSAPPPIAAPLRELPWGQLNFLHTTDTHGWHGGHLQEPQYSADWGDYISFAKHLRDRADSDGTDLLLIDTGDRVEGNGLYDASDPKGKYTLDIIKGQDIDVLTVGNHELYQHDTSQREYEEVVPAFKNSYIASNLDVVLPETGEQVPLAPRFRKFTTTNQGIRIVAFGFLFNFRGNANNTVVKQVEKVLEEDWFKDAVRDKEVDLFLVTGHLPVRDSPELDAIYKAIRNANWNTPIAVFGGHTHVRDFRKLEKRAWALESGRYMETLGFMSLNGIRTGNKDKAASQASLSAQRLYIDNNLFSLHHHSGKNDSTFDTELGRNVSAAISKARSSLGLDHVYGCAPRDLWLSRAPYPAENSLLSWLEEEVFPDTLKNVSAPTIMLTNTGAIRFDIFKGPFTFDSNYLVSPFTSGFRKVKDVPYAAASQVLKILNNQGPIISERFDEDYASFPELTAKDSARALLPPHIPENEWTFSSKKYMLAPPSLPKPHSKQEARLSSKLSSNGEQIFFGDKPGSTEPQVPGYTTVDDGGREGDDTVHRPIQFYASPNCIAANIGFADAAMQEDDTVDIVYNEFIENWVLLALRYAGEKRTREQTSPALDGLTLTDVMGDWISEHWHCE